MPKQKTLEEAYQSCRTDNFFEEKEALDKNKAKSMLQLSETILEVAQTTKKNLDSKSPKWSVVYILYYDVLRELANLIIGFDQKKISNHQCLFAYLCWHHPELELSWDFFENTEKSGIFSVPKFA